MKTRSMPADQKRRKVDNGEVKMPTSMSCCSSNESKKILQLTDLKERVESRRISKLRSKIKTKSGLRKTAKPSPVISSRGTIQMEKLPSAAELEEFFTAAEKQLNKRFKEKYNYDIANDTPLEGRFEWVQLKL
ncbi:hypothetical protein QVD17_18708 [Tagetes erecta]|uniref:Cyclin-dependent kinase inhibitor domain-containing protein n=1 Tax=Tagetes erecta TaxID=13708 RepID=A0AAD8NPB2_TARER|nr:hypothetical protein QVD17_18708 [Tagetes erecta]